MQQLIVLFPALDNIVDSDCADLLIRVAFYEKKFCSQPHISFDDLDSMQQAVLQTLVAKETIWLEEDAGFYQESSQQIQVQQFYETASVEALVCVGLPRTRQALQAFLSTSTHL